MRIRLQPGCEWRLLINADMAEPSTRFTGSVVPRWTGRRTYQQNMSTSAVVLKNQERGVGLELSASWSGPSTTVLRRRPPTARGEAGHGESRAPCASGLWFQSIPHRPTQQPGCASRHSPGHRLSGPVVPRRVFRLRCHHHLPLTEGAPAATSASYEFSGDLNGARGGAQRPDLHPRNEREMNSRNSPPWRTTRLRAGRRDFNLYHRQRTTQLERG